MKSNMAKQRANKKSSSAKEKAVTRRTRRTVKDDIMLMEDLNFESDIKREIDSVFEDAAYPQSSWQKISCLMERAELEDWLLNSKYLH